MGRAGGEGGERHITPGSLAPAIIDPQPLRAKSTKTLSPGCDAGEQRKADSFQDGQGEAQRSIDCRQSQTPWSAEVLHDAVSEHELSDDHCEIRSSIRLHIDRVGGCGGINLDGSHITWVKQRGTRWRAVPGMHRCRWVKRRWVDAVPARCRQEEHERERVCVCAPTHPRARRRRRRRRSAASGLWMPPVTTPPAGVDVDVDVEAVSEWLSDVNFNFITSSSSSSSTTPTY